MTKMQTQMALVSPYRDVLALLDAPFARAEGMTCAQIRTALDMDNEAMKSVMMRMRNVGLVRPIGMTRPLVYVATGVHRKLDGRKERMDTGGE